MLEKRFATTIFSATQPCPPNAPSFFPSSLSPTPFNPCYADYITVAKFCSQTSLYRIDLHVGGLPFFKCDEMRLRWVFIVQTEVILLKNIFEFDWLYTGRAGGSSGRKGFNNIFSNIFTVCPTWPGSSKVLSRLRAEPFSPLFFFFSFFLFRFLFSYCDFIWFLYTA